MKTLIESCISWSKLGEHPKADYIFSVGNAVIDRKSKILTITVILNCIIPVQDTHKMQKILKKEFPELADVRFRFLYEDVILTKKEIVSHFLPYLVEDLSGEYASLMKAVFPEKYTFADDKLTLMVLTHTMAKQLTEKVSKQIEACFKREFGLTLCVEFVNHGDSCEEKELERAKLDALELETVKTVAIQAQIEGKQNHISQKSGEDGKKVWKKGAGNNHRTPKYTPVDGNIIMGKEILLKVTPIQYITEESGLVAVEGKVFRKEGRQLKNGKYLVTLGFADQTGSLGAKIFATGEKWTDIDEHIKIGSQITICGSMEFDTYESVMVLMGKDIQKSVTKERKDEEEEKRVELHAHTKISAMDGIMEISELVKTAAAWGHKAVAITDHGVVQGFPDAAKIVKKNKLNVKLIFGLEGYFLDDSDNSSVMPIGLSTEEDYVVFDLETTGLSPTANEIIEIGAIKVKNKTTAEIFSTFVKPTISHIPERITELTGITDAMVLRAPTLDEVLGQFLAFAGTLPLVAHNADFDVAFMKVACQKRGLHLENQKVDTLYMARTLLPQLKRHKLNHVAEALGVSLENHHRAVDDAKATAEILIKFFLRMEEAGFSKLSQIEKVVGQEKQLDYKTKATNHIILLAKNQTGLKNIYKLVSKSHLDYFYKKPRIPRSVLMEHREGILVGSACEAGQLYQAILNDKTAAELDEIVAFYDYLEIQPLCNNRFLIEKGKVADEAELKEINRKIIELGRKHNKLVVATTDAHYKEKEDAVYRRVLMAGQGYKDTEDGNGLYMRTTEEMLEEFSYLGEETAREVVIHAPGLIADLVEAVAPVPEGKFPPKIENAENTLRERCMKTAIGIYGEPLPSLISDRLEKELSSIIGNGYAVMYVSAEMLVQKSLSDGYLVGSRGSVGSSFAATMAGITEVNPLPPHYICENQACRNSEFVEDDGTYDCGVDMPDKLCPLCGKPYKKDGFNIPFETFLGFDGDKEPDIDLNFAGEYQPVAHKFVEEIFGKENVFRAGTIGTIAGKTAYGFVLKYFEEKGQAANKWELERLAEGCTGVRRTTGQHPGGIIIVPDGHEIYEFCPVQHPANDMKTDIITTHFDYHSIDENLLKLDILGHDVPSMIRQLQDITGQDPLCVPLRDEKVNGIFNGIEGLDIKLVDYKFVHGSYGIPEFGTKFVRQMLDDTNPKTFADLVRISGFSHGTDVWINNAQEFIKSKQATMREAISTRDDIMNYLIQKGVPKKTSFKIMEGVRKGRGVTDEQVEIMEENNVPEWYIESCRRIKYMFPKAHAVAYVMMSYRIAYYKVYYPAAFYAVFFTMKISEFNSEVILKGVSAILNRINEIEEKGKEATKKEEDEVTVLEVAYEMYARGYEFSQAKLLKSHATKFDVVDGKVLLPFMALTGVGENAAKRLVSEAEKEEFYSVEDVKERVKLNKTALTALKTHGVFAGLPDSDQLSLFSAI